MQGFESETQKKFRIRLAKELDTTVQVQKRASMSVVHAELLLSKIIVIR